MEGKIKPTEPPPEPVEEALEVDWDESAVCAEWQRIHDEYGDAAPLLSQFKEQRWREAVAKARKLRL